MNEKLKLVKFEQANDLGTVYINPAAVMAVERHTSYIRTQVLLVGGETYILMDGIATVVEALLA